MQDKSFVLLTICFNLISAEYIIQSDGWVPVTRNQVYNQACTEWKRNIVHSTIKPAIDTTNIITFLNFLKNSDEKNIKSKEDEDSFRHLRHDFSPELSSRDQRNLKLKHEITTKVVDTTLKVKNIVESNTQNNVDIMGDTNTNDDVKVNLTETAIADRSSIYEVTEDNITGDLDDLNEDIAYIYTKPDSDNINYTSEFSKILSKYNIKTDDKLRNYELSRQIKTENPIKSPYRVWVPYKYNSLNHLPVDPLLAVFLSNYGVYLPSLYGIKSNYNNLYGYLASNNIHNNRPFGLYKIFSDTDSWN